MKRNASLKGVGARASMHAASSTLFWSPSTKLYQFRSQKKRQNLNLYWLA